MSNIKQIGLAFLQYTQDYDENYPLSSYPSTSVSWTTGAQPYMKSVQMFRCPSDSGTVWSAPAAPPANNYYTTSYLMNAWMSGQKPYRNLAAIQSPSKIVLLAESNNLARDHFHPFNWVADPEFPSSPAAWTLAPDGQSAEFPRTRHLEGFNMAYCDGHAKWTKWSMVWPPKAGEPLEGAFDPRQ